MSDWPINPVVDQIYMVNNRVYRFNGNGWDAITNSPYITETRVLEKIAEKVISGANESEVELSGEVPKYISGWSLTSQERKKFDVSKLGIAEGLNFTASSMKKFRKHRSKVTANVSDIRIVCLGDSTTAGQGASTIYGSYPFQLAKILSRLIAPAVMAATPQPASFSPNDTRVVKGSGWTTSGHGVIGGGSFSAPTNASGDLSITFDHDFDTIVVPYWRNTGNGTSQINVDGGSNLGSGIVTSGSNSLQSTSFSVTKGFHQINIKPPTVGTIYILGVEGILSTEKRIQVWNEGRSGARSDTFISNSNVYDGLPTLIYLNPALTTISLGINDAALSTDPVLYANRLVSLITSPPNSSIILLTPPLSSLPPGRGIEFSTYEAMYVPYIYYIADLLNCGLIDWQARLGPYASSSVDGFMNDTVHPNEAGYGDLAQMIGAALLTI